MNTARTNLIMGCVILAALTWAGGTAAAKSTYLTAWKNKYPASTLPDRMAAITGSQCYVCHHPPSTGATGNCYREDLKALLDGGMAVIDAINTLDLIDSDLDGVLNGVEALTMRPGGEIGYSQGLIGDQGTDPCSDEPTVPVTGVPETPPPPCTADIDGSGAVDFGDLLLVLSTWGQTGVPEDLDESGVVDFGDLLLVLSSWGACA